MATDQPYSSQFNAEDLKQSLASYRPSFKRKRDPSGQDGSSNSRAAPDGRRSAASQLQQNAAPEINMTDASFLGSGQNTDFDLSAFQHDGGSSTGQNTNGSSAGANADTAAAALSHSYNMTVPAHPGEGFADQPTVGVDDVGEQLANAMNGNNGGKPAVGTEEWHKQRKDSHKEVERRRRETINEGINELAKIVPGCEKNKGSILARAVQYIQKLHDDASQNIDKWTFEKLVTEQAIAEMSAKFERAWRHAEAWRKLAIDHGVVPDGFDPAAADPAVDPSAADADAAPRAHPADDAPEPDDPASSDAESADGAAMLAAVGAHLDAHLAADLADRHRAAAAALAR